jgi:hypothetical protein
VTFTAVVVPTLYPNGALDVPGGAVSFSSPTFQFPAACSSVTLTPSGANDGSASASCPVTFPHSATPPGQASVTATYSDTADKNFTGSSNNPPLTQTIQDYNTTLVVKPATTPVGNISNATPPVVYLSPNWNPKSPTTDTGTDVFGAASITVQISTSSTYNPLITVTCSVYAGSVTPPPSTTVAPAMDPTCTTATASQMVQVASNAAAPTFVITATPNAPVGAYTVILSVVDSNFAAGIQYQSFPLYIVAPTSSILNLAQGTSGT